MKLTNWTLTAVTGRVPAAAPGASRVARLPHTGVTCIAPRPVTAGGSGALGTVASLATVGALGTPVAATTAVAMGAVVTASAKGWITGSTVSRVQTAQRPKTAFTQHNPAYVADSEFRENREPQVQP